MNTDDLVRLRHLVDRYAAAVDHRDAAALADIFAGDGVLRVQPDGGPVQEEWSGAEVVRLLEPLARYDATFHHVGGCVFSDGPDADSAGGTAHCTAHHYERTPNGPVDLVMMIEYHDRYRRAAGAWRISERRVAVRWTELHPAHPRRRPGA